MSISKARNYLLGKNMYSSEIVVAASDSVDKNGADFLCDGTNDEVEAQQALSIATGRRVHFLDGHFVKGNAAGMTVQSGTIIDLDGTWTLASGVNDDAYIFANVDKINGNQDIVIINGIYDLNFANNSPTTKYQALCDFENVDNYYINTYITNFTMLEAKAKNCTGALINTKFQQSEVSLCPCEATNEWTVSGDGTISLDTNDFMVGSGSIKCSITTASTKAITLDKNLPALVNSSFEAYDVTFYIKIEDMSKLTSIGPIGASTGSLGSDSFVNTLTSADLPYHFRNGEWFRVRVPLNRYLASASPHTPFWRLKITCNADTSVWLDDVRLIPVACDPAVTFEWDDARIDALTGIAIQEPYGHRVSVAQMGSDDVGGDHCTVAQLDALAAAGHDINAHAGTHLPDETLGAFEAEVENTIAFLSLHGWPGIEFWTFPGNDSSADALDFVEDHFLVYRRPYGGTANVATARYANGRMQSVRQQLNSYAVINEAEKAAMRHHGWIIHYGHGVNVEGGTDYALTAEKLTEWCEFWYNWGMLSKPPSSII